MQHLDTCPICSSQHFACALNVLDHHLTKEAFTLVDCLGCGFRFTNPRPQEGRVGEYYQSGSYISHAGHAVTFTDRLYLWARSLALRNKLRRVRRYVPSGALLDVGCGTGSFLHFMATHGYRTLGVEPSPKARSIAQAQSGRQIVASVSEIPANERFDVITLWHVLEHLPNLRPDLHQIQNSLSAGGYLFIAVPNRLSWDAAHYGALWAALDVPRHLSHFRPIDIERVLGEGGSSVVNTYRMWFDAPYICMLSERYKGHGGLRSFLVGTTKGVWSNCVSLITGRPTSSSLYIVRKPVS